MEVVLWGLDRDPLLIMNTPLIRLLREMDFTPG